jgi:hypothetical protein
VVRDADQLFGNVSGVGREGDLIALAQRRCSASPAYDESLA